MTISSLLIDWYHIHQRELPWRNTSNPYLIWLSEIILQQTRVQQGFDYYLRFAHRFPTVQSLAEADEQEVLNLWQGLGYYSRARNLHHSARMIVEQFNGIFPSTYNDIRSLKGVGNYTASAIASFAYGLPHAVVDGNVQRVISRLFAIDTPIDSTKGMKEIQAIADELIDPKRPALHNQAMMELGSLQCTPSSPDCSVCPLASHCLALSRNEVSRLPIKAGKTVIKNRYFNYLFVKCGNHTLLQQRTQKDIWQNLYQFPLIETDHPASLDEITGTPPFIALCGGHTPTIRPLVANLKHVLSHRILYASLYEVQLPQLPPAVPPLIVISTDEIDHYPLPRLMELLLENS